MSRPTPLYARLLFANLGLLTLGGGFTLGGVMLWRESKWFWVPLLIGLLLLAFTALRMLRLAQHPNPAEAHPLPSDLPVDARLAIVRRGQWLMPLILIPYSVWVAYDLYRLETGAVDEVSLWAPVGDVYQYFGFWPGVLMMPLITVGFVLIGFFGGRALAKEAADAARSRGAA
jgi:hypothetical protein